MTRSIFTGTVAVPLKGPWMELKSCKLIDIVAQTTGDEEEMLPLAEERCVPRGTGKETCSQECAVQQYRQDSIVEATQVVG